MFSSLASRVRDYYLADNRDFHCLAFFLTQVAEMVIFPSPESSWADSCYPGYSFLRFVLLVGFGVGFFPGGGELVWGGAGNPQSHFQVFFLRLSELFILLLFLTLTISGILLNVPHHLIYSSPSKHERNVHTLPECHN